VDSGGDGRNDVNMPVDTRCHNSNGRMTSARLSLLESIIATGDFCPSLLCYHCSDVVVVMGRMFVATAAYHPFLEWCDVVVNLAH
jgi:hypothetical protein